MFVPPGQFERLVFIYFSLQLNKLQFLNQLKISTLAESWNITLKIMRTVLANQKRDEYGIRFLVNWFHNLIFNLLKMFGEHLKIFSVTLSFWNETSRFQKTNIFDFRTWKINNFNKFSKIFYVVYSECSGKIKQMDPFCSKFINILPKSNTYVWYRNTMVNQLLSSVIFRLSEFSSIVHTVVVQEL